MPLLCDEMKPSHIARLFVLANTGRFCTNQAGFHLLFHLLATL